jgi:hypothetical protein
MTFLFFEDNQPTKEAWQVLLNLGTTWNDAHISHFVREDHLSIELPGGIEDPEFSELDGAITDLKRSHNIKYFKGVDSPYANPEAIGRADFIHVIGEEPPAGFLMNEIEACGSDYVVAAGGW